MWTLPDAEIRKLAAEELECIGMIDKADVLDGTVIRVPKAYPAYFGWSMFQSCLVYVFASRIDWVAKRLTIDPKRLERPFWHWLRERGAFWLALMIVLIIGPITMALVLRYLALPERKAWLYAFTANLIATVVVVSAYLGLIGIIKAHLLSLAAR